MPRAKLHLNLRDGPLCRRKVKPEHVTKHWLVFAERACPFCLAALHERVLDDADPRLYEPEER